MSAEKQSKGPDYLPWRVRPLENVDGMASVYDSRDQVVLPAVSRDLAERVVAEANREAERSDAGEKAEPENPHRLPWTVVSVEHSAWVRECDGKDVVFTSTRDAKKIVDAANAMPPGHTLAANKMTDKEREALEAKCDNLFKRAEKLWGELSESERKREEAEKELKKISVGIVAKADRARYDRQRAKEELVEAEEGLNHALGEVKALEALEEMLGKEGGAS